jgi:hypothetical protein
MRAEGRRSEHRNDARGSVPGRGQRQQQCRGGAEGERWPLEQGHRLAAVVAPLPSVDATGGPPGQCERRRTTGESCSGA